MYEEEEEEKEEEAVGMLKGAGAVGPGNMYALDGAALAHDCTLGIWV